MITLIFSQIYFYPNLVCYKSIYYKLIIMKKNIPFIIMLLALNLVIINSSKAQFTLGDIAFTTYNSDGTADQFSFVLLRSVAPGDSISFTENGWKGDGSGFRSGENTVTLVFSNSYNCGSQIYISANPFGARDESSSSAGTLVGNGLALTTSGDQIFAYDPANIPNANDSSGFIAAIHMNGGWDNDASSTNTSALPGVLTDGVNAISISPEVDNAQYDCSTISGSPSSGLDTAINNMNNWNVDNTNNFVAPAPCTISCAAPPCNGPTVPTATTNPQTVCDGDSVLMTISGTLNDATMWSIYTGSCGGTLYGTTNTTSMMVTVSTPSTTYYLRGEGGCVTPGLCGQVTAFGLANDDASFAYSASSYCQTDAPTTPTATTPNGTYSSTPAGLSISPTTGVITPTTSTVNTYTVYYTTNGTCPSTDSTTITITICTGLDEIATKEVNIYPNPNQGNFMIDVADFNGVTLTIVDALGKEIINQNLNSSRTNVDLSNFKQGVYIVKLKGDNINITKKVITK